MAHEERESVLDSMQTIRDDVRLPNGMKRLLEPRGREPKRIARESSQFGSRSGSPVPIANSRVVSRDASRSPLPCMEGDRSTDLICFGSLCDIATQVRNDPGAHINPPNAAMLEVQAYTVFDILLDRQSCWIKTHVGEPFGCLASNSVQKLKKLVPCPCIEIDAFTTSKALSKARIEWKKSGKSTILHLDINIYGHSHYAKKAAQILSAARLFLQPPSYDHRALPYENPQYLKLSGLKELQLAIETETISSKRPNDLIPGPLTFDVEAVLDHLPQPKFLVEIATDSRITTILKKHQKEAADFMTRRETGNLPPSLTLWKIPTSESWRFGYQHVITGAKSSSMEDALGGILADDMGLGKTLSTLAVIVASLARAIDFAVSNTEARPALWHDLVPCKTTLVVVPSALLLDSWTEEIQVHIRSNTIAVYRYHGSSRRIAMSTLLQYDIVLTTYATIAAEFCRGQSILDHILWYRIVLDEAHLIRNPSTKQYRALCALSAHIRWCLTGTPIQNSLEDLGALLKFIRVPILEDIPTFRRYVIMPITTSTSGRFANLRRVLEALCLRRTKSLLKLPDPATDTHILELSEAETELYRDYGESCKRFIDLAVSGHTMKKANQLVIEALLRMRLFCNHGQAALLGKWHPLRLPSNPEEVLSYLQTNGKANCVQCECNILSMYQDGDRTSGSLTTCQHLLCGECLPAYKEDLASSVENDGRTKCPICGQESDFDSFILQPSCTADDDVERASQSTKLLRLLDNIRCQDTDEKSVVFSFWKKTLDIAAKIFDSHSIQYYCIHGSIPTTKRTKILEDFVQSQSIKVLLITFSTGSVGINKLVVANRIHIIEPQWNPSVESQAIGRILRLGQERAVTVVRYIMKDTVEEAVQSRQLRKLQLARGGFGLGKDGHASQRIQEIMELIYPSSKRNQL